MNLTSNEEAVQRQFDVLLGTTRGTTAYYAVRDRLFNQLLEQFAPLQCKREREWCAQYNLSSDEFVSLYYDSLLKAIEHYDNNTCKFVTYFWTTLRNTMLNLLSKRRAKRRIPSTDCFSVDTGGATESLNVGECISEQDYVPAQLVEPDDSEVVANIADLRQWLSPVDQRLFDQLLAGYAHSDLKQEMGLSEYQMFTRLRKLRRKLQRLYGKR